MSTNRSRRIDRAAAEQLLGGVTVDPEAGQDPSAGQQSAPGRPELAALLAAAATSEAAGDGPLPGEEGAMAAFRQARHQPDPRPHRRRKMADTALARALSAKAVAVALGVTALGGVAVAAGTGRLPESLGGPAPAPAATSAAPAPTTDAPATASGTPGGGRTGKPSAGTTRPGTGPARPSGQPATGPADLPPDLDRLCEVFAGRVAAGGKPKDTAAVPELAELLKAAGTPEKVTGFCALLAGHDRDQQSGQPSAGTGRGKPSAGPGQSASPSASAPSPGRTGHGDSQQSKQSNGGSDQD
ncbi:hypothetical protein [Kitasatospora cineracea]|uniref:Uncharacterized protein n=1 Tax=Kitasatospora cineracea TaxID=88074 RepID=A0A3N4RMC2_9ACTN|nr:hypothetical protein [Kitasatospora cineracea]RPE33966.1 hypothetical protein EDD38_2273 [Kitasatospora cineracea]